MAGMFDDLIPGKADKPADFGMFADLVPAPPPAAGAMRKLADVGLAGAQGVVSGVKMFSDLAGADNRVSGALESANEGIGSLMSKARQMELAARSKTIDEANASGDTWEQVKAYMGGFAEAPASTIAQGVGSLVPTLPAMLIGGPAAAGGAALRAGAMMGVGAAQGVGAVKGSTFERVREGLLKDGYQPDEATARATEAQSYLGANSTDMMVAGVIGAVTGRLGVEGAIESIFHGATKAAGKTLPRVAGGMASQGLTEAAQGGQEQFAGNRALTNAGIETDPMMGVLGAGVLEGTVGAAIGGALAFKAPRASERAADQGLADLSNATDADSAVDAFTRATDVPLTVPPGFQDGPALDRLDAMRLADEQGLRNFGPEPARPLVQPQPEPARAAPSAEFIPTAPFGDRVLTLREQLADKATREAVRERWGPKGLSQAMYSASAADNMDLNIPDKTRDRMLALAERIVGESVLKPINRPGVGPADQSLAVGVDQTPDVPRIGLDTTPTGTIRVDAQGQAAPETRADAISSNQPRTRPDGMTQQVMGRPLPRDGVMVGDGTLTTPERKTAAPAGQTLLLTVDNMPYGTKSGAAGRAAKDGGEVVSVPGGWAVSITSILPDGRLGSRNTGGTDAGNAGGPGVSPTTDPGRGDRVAGVPDSRSGDVLAGAGSPEGQGVAGPGTAGDGAQPVALTAGQVVTLPGKDGTPEAWTVVAQDAKMVKLDNGKGRMRAVQVGSPTWAAIQPEGGAATAETISANGGSEAAAGQPAAATLKPAPKAEVKTDELSGLMADSGLLWSDIEQAIGRPMRMDDQRHIDIALRYVRRKSTETVTATQRAPQADAKPATAPTESDDARMARIRSTLPAKRTDADLNFAQGEDRAARKRQQEADRAEQESKTAANKPRNITQRSAANTLDKPNKLPPSAGLGTGTRRDAMDKAVEQSRTVVDAQVDDTAARKRDQEAVEDGRRRDLIPNLTNPNAPGMAELNEAAARLKANKYRKSEYRVYGGPKQDGPFHVISKTEFDYAQERAQAAPEGARKKRERLISERTDLEADGLKDAWALTREQYFNDPARVRKDAIGGGTSTSAGWIVNYEYTSPSGAGPFKGRLVQKSKAGIGDTIAAPFGQARVTSVSAAKNAASAVDNGELLELGKAHHKRVVADALAEGKPVPAEVLADYPDLKRLAPNATPLAPASKGGSQSDTTPASNAAAQETQPASDGETAGETEAAAPTEAPTALPDPFADNYAALNGKTITQQVMVVDTGKTATLRMDAGQALRDMDEREQALTKLKACIGR